MLPGPEGGGPAGVVEPPRLLVDVAGPGVVDPKAFEAFVLPDLPNRLLLPPVDAPPPKNDGPEVFGVFAGVPKVGAELLSAGCPALAKLKGLLPVLVFPNGLLLFSSAPDVFELWPGFPKRIPLDGADDVEPNNVDPEVPPNDEEGPALDMGVDPKFHFGASDMIDRQSRYSDLPLFADCELGILLDRASLKSAHSRKSDTMRRR